MEIVAQPGILRMFRGDAAQHYPIKQATWGFSTDEKYSVPILSFAIETEKQKVFFRKMIGGLIGQAGALIFGCVN
jgi:hypothetical protein